MSKAHRIPRVQLKKGGYHIAFSPDGQKVALLGRKVHLFKALEETPERTLEVKKNPSYLDFSLDGEKIAIKFTSGAISTVDLSTGVTDAKSCIRVAASLNKLTTDTCNAVRDAFIHVLTKICSDGSPLSASRKYTLMGDDGQAHPSRR